MEKFNNTKGKNIFKRKFASWQAYSIVAVIFWLVTILTAGSILADVVRIFSGLFFFLAVIYFLADVIFVRGSSLFKRFTLVPKPSQSNKENINQIQKTQVTNESDPFHTQTMNVPVGSHKAKTIFCKGIFMWLRNNWFKLSIIILLFVMFFGTYIYLNNLNESRNKIELEKIIADKEESCRGAANKYKVDDIKNPPDSTYFSYEFKYNQNTGMCIVAYVADYNSSAFLGNSREYIIMDLFSGKEILGQMVYGAGKGMVDERTIFDNTKNEYFTRSTKKD